MSRTNEKKMNDKKNVQEAAGWAIAHFPVVGHDTVDCMATGKGPGA